MKKEQENHFLQLPLARLALPHWPRLKPVLILLSRSLSQFIPSLSVDNTRDIAHAGAILLWVYFSWVAISTLKECAYLDSLSSLLESHPSLSCNSKCPTHYLCQPYILFGLLNECLARLTRSNAYEWLKQSYLSTGGEVKAYSTDSAWQRD
jgi:hypothetical protein